MFKDILRIIAGVLDLFRSSKCDDGKPQKTLDVSGSVWDKPAGDDGAPPTPKPPRPPRR